MTATATATNGAATSSAIAPTAANPIGTAPPSNRIVTVDSSQFENMLDTAKFEHMWRVAKMYSESKLVPQQYQGDAPSCWIACQMAVRLGVDPFMFMQNTYVVQGKPGMEAKLAIALVNTSGIFDGPIQWKLSGEGMERQCTAFAVHAGTRQICECTVSMQTAQAEGWLAKSGSKWKTMPDQMLRYRSAAWFARLFCPERIMGMQTADEIEDTAPETRHVENTARGSAGLLNRLEARRPEVIIDDPRPTQKETPAPVAFTFKGKPDQVEAANALYAKMAARAIEASATGDDIAERVRRFVDNATPDGREEPFAVAQLTTKTIRDVVAAAFDASGADDWKAATD